MSVDPGLLNANVLAWAINADAPQHSVSRALLDAACDPSVTLYVTSQILCELYLLITNQRRVTSGIVEHYFGIAGPFRHVCAAGASPCGRGMDATA
jgi:predicted nucleic acid-binding protein